MKTKYVPERRKNAIIRPTAYKVGTCPLRRDKRYAWLRHKAQCKFRNEEYNISWEDWENIWSDEDFLKRGRGIDDLCLMKVEIDGDWSVANTQVIRRLDQLQRNTEYRRDNR